jgi:geranylgeranylglycerol-phosphate geranylgeranyltransferase
MIRRLLVPLEITRPHNMLAAALSVAAGYYIAGGRDAGTIVLPVVLTALITGAGNVINDYRDIHIDRINKPRRPLPSERLSPRAALSLYVFLTVALAAGCMLLRPPALAGLMLAWQLALFAYAVWFKRVFIAGNLLVAVVAASAFFAGALAGGNARASVIPVALAFGFVLCREVVKGCEDVEGDNNGGVHTAAVVFGERRAGAIASAMMALMAVLIPLPAFVAGYSQWYLWIMLVLVVPLLAYGAWAVVRRPGRKTYNHVSWALKFGMFFGIIAIAAGYR